MKFKKLVEQILLEFDREDPSDQYWPDWSSYKKINKPKKVIQKSKSDTVNLFDLSDIENSRIENITPINNPTDLVYIKLNTLNIKTGIPEDVRYLTYNKNNPFTWNKTKAGKFPLLYAQQYVQNNTRDISFDNRFEQHFEIESVYKTK